MMEMLEKLNPEFVVERVAGEVYTGDGTQGRMGRSV